MEEKINIQSVNDKAFEVYGRVVDGYDYAELLATLEKCSEKPADSVIYVPGCAELEATPAYKDLQINCYGGMPIQIGYCNGTNTKLNCFEYHRDSEIDIAADDVILLVARQQDIQDGKIDSSKTECSAKLGEGFRVVIVLPKGTNEDKPALTVKNAEDNLLWAQNKWLLAHKDTAEAADGAHVGITGDNIDITDLIK